MSNSWVQIEHDQWIKRNPDGTVTLRRVEKTGEIAKACAEMRKETRGNLRSTEAKHADLRFIARLPVTVHNEMVRTCGNDPDKQKAFLRDHPEFLGVDRKNAGLPGKKITIDLKARRRKR